MGVTEFFKDFWTEVQVIKGEKTKDKHYTSRNHYSSRTAAENAFQRAKEKLFKVNEWSDLPGISSAFRVYTAAGNIKASGQPEVGDYIFINLPGPTPETWVKVVDQRVEEELAQFTVSPSNDPRERGEKVKDVEHFFADEATSTFRVALEGTTLMACEIGREEGVNNQGKKAGGREVVNTLIAVGGWIAVQEMQWRKLTDYLVHKISLEGEGKHHGSMLPENMGLLKSKAALYRLAKTSAASVAGTTAMTAFSYGLSRLAGEQFREPQLLSYLLYKDSWRKRISEARLHHIRGHIAHYLAGQGFGLGYEYLWKPSVKLPTLARGATYGMLAGLFGVAVWESFIQIQAKPRNLHRKTYYPHLLLAHVVFGTTAALVSKALEKK